MNPSATSRESSSLDKEQLMCSLDLGREDVRAHLIEQILGLIVKRRVQWFRDDGGLPLPPAGRARPARPGDTYNFRGAWCGGIPFSLFHPCGFNQAPIAPAQDYPFDWHWRMIEDYRRVRKYYMGDFYPLAGCSASAKEWFVYQMDRLDFWEGVFVVLRRPAAWRRHPS